jgi:glycine hydroxymethyltransferase
VDLNPIGVTGQEAEDALESVHITVNKNAIPYDPRPPRVTSGLRLGTPALTSRGFGRAEMAKVAELIVAALEHRKDPKALARVSEEAQALAVRFPVPGLDS